MQASSNVTPGVGNTSNQSLGFFSRCFNDPSNGQT